MPALGNHIDFVRFFTGLGFVLLAVACDRMRRRRDRTLPWEFLGLFGLVQSFGQWIHVVELSTGELAGLAWARLALHTIAGLSLLEFGRRSFARDRARIPGPWILLPALALGLTGAGGGFAGVGASMRLGLALPAGIVAAVAFFRAANRGSPHARALHWAGFASGLAAVQSILLGPRREFFPFNEWNEGALQAATGVPPELPRLLAALVLAVSVHRFAETSRRRGEFAPPVPRSWHSAHPVLLLCLVIAGGWVVTELTDRHGIREFVGDMARVTATGASLIDTDEVEEALASAGPASATSRARLQAQLQTLHTLIPECRWVALRGLREGEVVTIATTDPAGGGTEPSDDGCQDLPDLGMVRDLLRDPGGLDRDPRTRFDGPCLRVNAPVGCPDGVRPLAVLETEFSSQTVLTAQARARLVPIFLTGCLCTFLMLVVTYRQRASESRRHLSVEQARMRAFFDALPGYAFVKDTDGTYLAANTAFCRFLGRTEDDVIGRNTVDIHPPDVAERLIEDDRRALAEPSGAMVTEHALDDDGRPVIVSFRKVPWTSESGQVLGLIGLGFDITGQKQVEEALRDAGEFNRQVIARASGGIIVYDRELRHIVWNEFMERLSGHPAAEVLDRTSLEVFPHLREQGVDGFLLRALAGDTVTTPEILFHSPRNGRTAWIVSSYQPHRGASGQIVGVLAVVRDVTEARRSEQVLRESEAKYRTIYQGSSDAIFLLTDRYQDCNEKACELLRCSRAEIVGHTPAEFSPPLQPSGISSEVVGRHLIEAAMTDRPVRFDWRHQAKDGTILETEVSLSGVTLKGARILQATVRDVSEQRRAAEDLRRAKDAAVAASQAKGQFLANMSHEIRTPMNGVLGMASLLQGTELTWEQREYVETIRTSAEALLTVINDILDLSKIEAGRIDIEEIGFDLRKTMEEASGLLMPQARVKGLELACHYPPELPSDFRGDPGRIRQVLLNLGGNAVKFTERGRVVLEARPIRVGEDRVTVRLQVDDTGIGIAPEKLAVVFDSFTQADSSTTRRYGGTGLGLTVSRRLVELMDGRIGVESERGRGSSFWFELDLPRHAPTAADSPAGGSPAPAAATTAKQPPLPGVRVLLVEDNVVNQRVARKMLEQLGCSVSVVGNGHEAVMAASPRMHDVILMDCQMPVLDGYEATAAIRRAEESTGARVPIIAMTAHAMEGDRAKCLGAGMDDYMAKPIRPPELLQMLQKWCPGGEIERAA